MDGSVHCGGIPPFVANRQSTSGHLQKRNASPQRRYRQVVPKCRAYRSDQMAAVASLPRGSCGLRDRRLADERRRNELFNNYSGDTIRSSLLSPLVWSRRKVAMISAAQELTTRIQARLETLHGFTINIEFVDNGVLSLPRGQFKMFKFPFSKMHVPFYMRIQTPTQSAPSPIVTAHHEVGIEINDPAVQEMVSRMSPEELRMNMFSTLTNP